MLYIQIVQTWTLFGKRSCITNIVLTRSRCGTRYSYLLRKGLFESRNCTPCYWVSWYWVPFSSLGMILFKVLLFFVSLFYMGAYQFSGVFRNSGVINDFVCRYLTDRFPLCQQTNTCSKLIIVTLKRGVWNFKDNDGDTRTKLLTWFKVWFFVLV